MKKMDPMKIYEQNKKKVDKNGNSWANSFVKFAFQRRMWHTWKKKGLILTRFLPMVYHVHTQWPLLCIKKIWKNIFLGHPNL